MTAAVTLPTRASGTEPARTHWTARAACRAPGVDPELFFPVGDAGPGLAQAAAAKRICAGCPVRACCLDWAVGAGEPDGIWGGTTPAERSLLRSSRHETVSAGHAVPRRPPPVRHAG